MKKTLVLLTALALSTAGIGTAMASEASEANMTKAPGVIASGGIGSCDALSGSPEDWSTTPLAEKLNADGVKFSSISTFGNCFKVAALDSKGNTMVELYNPTNFDRVM